jgi:hypothetical protein
MSLTSPIVSGGLYPVFCFFILGKTRGKFAYWTVVRIIAVMLFCVPVWYKYTCWM